MKYFIAILSVILCASHYHAQVELNKPLQLTGSGSDARISGIDEVSSPKDAASAERVQDGSLSYAPASGTNNLAVSLTPAPAAYQTGMLVHFKVAADNTGAVTLDVNGQGAKSVKKSVTADLAAGDIKSGQMVSVIYDGTHFQMLSQLGAAPSTSIRTYLPGDVCKFSSQSAATWTFQEMYPTAYNAGENLSRCYFIYGYSSHGFSFNSGGSGTNNAVVTCPGSFSQSYGGSCNSGANLTPGRQWSDLYFSTGGCISGINAVSKPNNGNIMVCF